VSREPAVTSSGELLSIGELARRTHVSTRTIRYYEELGVLPGPPRSTGGTRRYPSDYVFYLEAARALKQLGFSLEEIAELGKYALEGTPASTQTQTLLREMVSELAHRIRVLRSLHELIAGEAQGARVYAAALARVRGPGGAGTRADHIHGMTHR